MTNTLKDSIPALSQQLKEQSIADGLALLAKEFATKLTFSTSFSIEDQVVTHEILSHQLDIKIFTLDTGRIFPETYSTWNSTQEKYKAPISAYYPNQIALQNFTSTKGPNSFYESVENRKECCYIRKVEPLQRALAGNEIWVTGLRAEHSPTRQDLEIIEWDDTNKVIKYHPLLHWTTEQVRAYIQQHQVPYNPLHDKGFISIGCAPCTRAIQPGEDFRAGRWWWEDSSKKECGLHSQH